MEVGAREAARRLGIQESTVLSRAKRESWNLPKRKAARQSKAQLQSPCNQRPVMHCNQFMQTLKK